MRRCATEYGPGSSSKARRFLVRFLATCFAPAGPRSSRATDSARSMIASGYVPEPVAGSSVTTDGAPKPRDCPKRSRRSASTTRTWHCTTLIGV